MTRLLRWLEDVLWPRALQCLCCERCTDGGLLCPECTSQLQRLRLPAADGPVQSVWAYHGAAGSLIKGLKDDCIADCAKVLADGMAEALRDMQLPQDTVLTWVTMPPARLRERGIDHGRLLCEEIAARTGMKVQQMLHRTRDGHTQRGLSGERRRQNLQGRFACAAAVSENVLLIDDVFTTGATVETCMEILKRGGVQNVYALTAARVTRFDDIN